MTEKKKQRDIEQYEGAIDIANQGIDDYYSGFADYGADFYTTGHGGDTGPVFDEWWTDIADQSGILTS